MIYIFRWTDAAINDLSKFDRSIAERILTKAKWFEKQSNPFNFAKRLTSVGFGQYRFRVGDYRIIFDIEKNGKISILNILRVKHRREAYD